MLNRYRNTILFAVLAALLGLSERCSASPASSPPHSSKGSPHARPSQPRKVLRAWHGPLGTALHFSPKKAVSLDDKVDVPEDTEDDLEDEPRQAIQEREPNPSISGEPPWFDLIFAHLIAPARAREFGPPGASCPRFLSLRRLQI